MTVRRDPDAILAAWLDEGPVRLPEASRRAIAVTTRTTHQSRRPRWLPWRFPTMNGMSRFALAAVAVVAVALGGLYLFNPAPQGGTGGPPATPSPAATPEPSSSPSATARPALTGSYTSAIHGISISYPAGWTIEAATQAWTSGSSSECDPPCEDRIVEKESDSAFLSLASQPLGGVMGEQWAATVHSDPALGGTCGPDVETISIDGAPGMIARICPDGLLTAQTWVDGRGYFILLYRVDDVDWFKQILATVKLHPEDAVTPSASSSRTPSSSPSPS
jgi:hypothetical protein